MSIYHKFCTEITDEQGNLQELTLNYPDIKRYSNQMANVFCRAGIGRGDRVMLVLKRHYEYWFAVVALHKLGGGGGSRHPYADGGRLCLPDRSCKYKGRCLHAPGPDAGENQRSS